MLDIRKIRRLILKKLVPDFIWPNSVQLDGVIIPLRNSPYSFGIKRYLNSGNYEVPERTFVKKYLNEGDQVLEMGGSIGVLTAIISKIIGSTGRVVSIEADKKLVDYSKSWLESPSRIDIFNGYALPIYENKLNLKGIFSEGNGSLGGTVTFTDKSETKSGDIFFDIATLSSLFNFKPNILIVDIEGSESVLLSISPQFPKYIDLIIIEFHPSIYGNKIMDKMIEVIKGSNFIFLEKNLDVYVFRRS